jgi:hypothetical protein
MNRTLPDRRVIREYLLGRLDEQKELESNLSERILFNDELSEVVESIEDEIIEEYLDGALDSIDRNAVDEYFLRPLERKNKLHFARLLRQHFETKRNDVVRPPLGILPVTGSDASQYSIGVAPAAGWRHHLRTYGQFVALILLFMLGLTYISGIRKRQAQLEGALVQERERSATLASQASPLQPPMIALTLVADRSRGTGAPPHIEIKPSTQRIIVEIALPRGATGSYDVRLLANGKNGPLWSATLSPLVSPSGDARLMVDVPTRGIASDVYSFVVSSSPPQAQQRKYYDFEVRVKK